MSFAGHCVHCEHYHNGDKCCYCEKEFTPLTKTPDQHWDEIEEMQNGNSTDSEEE